MTLACQTKSFKKTDGGTELSENSQQMCSDIVDNKQTYAVYGASGLSIIQIIIFSTRRRRVVKTKLKFNFNLEENTVTIALNVNDSI